MVNRRSLLVSSGAFVAALAFMRRLSSLAIAKPVAMKIDPPTRERIEAIRRVYEEDAQKDMEYIKTHFDGHDREFYKKTLPFGVVRSSRWSV